MLTAAGTVPDLHRIPFSFFLLKRNLKRGKTKVFLADCNMNTGIFVANGHSMMSKLINYALLMIAFVLFHQQLAAQNTLSSADSTHLAILTTELTLSADQIVQADSILRASSRQLSDCDRELLRVSRSEAAQEEKENQQRELKEKKKSIRENRDLSITLLLTSEQRKIYDEKIKPQKPGVLHMGMNHDRSKCEVCVVK
jgi:hypothetical protein